MRQARLPFHQLPPEVGPEDAPGEAWAQGKGKTATGLHAAPELPVGTARLSALQGPLLPGL